jgi:homoserine dehydrogenase
VKNYRLVLAGFGNVNQGLLEILREHEQFLADQYQVQFTIVGISDLLLGNVYNPDGLDIDQLLEAAANDRTLSQVPAPNKDWDALTLIKQSNADVVVEASYTNLQTGQPAIAYVRQALLTGKHVVTSNKGPVALQYVELAQLAKEKGLNFGVEGTVMSGTPAIHLGQKILKAAVIQKVEGILNGTTNYILTQMETGKTYQDALCEAQKLGYAEADPTGDVEGFDTAGKIVILSQLLFERAISMQQVDRIGISQLSLHDVQAAQQAGERWKLIGSLEEKIGELHAQVAPLRLPASHPLANISGATNAITYDTQILGKVTLIGAGAGRKETGFALLSDLLAICRK